MSNTTSPSPRSHDPSSRGTSRLAAELHMFESTIKRVIQSPSEVSGEIFCLEAMYDHYDEHSVSDPIEVFKATADPDTMYHHQAMRQPDREDFKAAMDKELKDQMRNGNFIILRRKDLPSGTQILPTVW